MKSINNIFWTILAVAGLMALFPAAGFSQITFDSTSTGADGAYDPYCGPDPDQTAVVLDVGVTGVMNFTSFTLGQYCDLTFTPTGTGSEPVRLLVSGDVVIDGNIILDGTIGLVEGAGIGGLGGIGGPGGGDGGQGGSNGAYPNLCR